jgi:hypothetical protein
VLSKFVGNVLGKRPDRRGKKKNGAARGNSAKSAQSDLSFDGTVSSEDILKERRGVFGKVYIVPLSDLFDIIGKPSERLLSALELICERVLEKQVGDRGPWGEVQGEGYFFSFDDTNDEEAWAKANEIVDEIGISLLGARYKRSTIRMAIAQAEDIMVPGTEDTFDGAKVRAEIENVVGKDTSEVLREWADLKWKGVARSDNWQQIEHENKPDNTAEVPLVHDDETGKRAFNTALWKQRQGGNRRQQMMGWEGLERRQHNDRRSFARA